MFQGRSDNKHKTKKKCMMALIPFAFSIHLFSFLYFSFLVQPAEPDHNSLEGDGAQFLCPLAGLRSDELAAGAIERQFEVLSE